MAEARVPGRPTGAAPHHPGGPAAAQASRHGHGAIALELFNQDGDKVLEMDGYGFFGRRHPATPQELAGLDAQRGAS